MSTPIEIPMPLAGKSELLPVEKSEVSTSGYMLNVRPQDTMEKRLRIGKRPGMKKTYAQQIGGTTPILAICSVTTID